jgi:hypothetical protein
MNPFMSHAPPRTPRCRRRLDLPAEALECRILLSATTVDPGEGLDLVGRASDGTWWASSPHPDISGVLEHRIVATWNPAANWQHVQLGDFDDDGLDDIAGWDAATSLWWVSLSEPVGSTTLVGGWWSSATTWSDVAAIDLTVSHATGTDLIGRDGWGNWWGAVANGNGTFRNVRLDAWNPAAGWRDVRFVDFDNDGLTDIVGRTNDGSWWAAFNQGDFTFQNVFLAQWNEAAAWRDVLVVGGFDDAYDGELDDFRNAIMARSGNGEWWALSRRTDGTVETRLITHWNEAAGWQDARAANVLGSNIVAWGQTPTSATLGDEIVARAANGDWYALDPRTALTQVIGQWNPAAGWRDVQVVTFHTEELANRSPTNNYVDRIVGRTADGAWWSTGTVGTRNVWLGSWNEAAGWHDVHAEDKVGTPVEVASVIEPIPQVPLAYVARTYITIYAHRAGTAVTLTDVVPSIVGELQRVSIRYVVPPLGYVQTFVYAREGTVIFDGADGGDAYISRTSLRSVARGGAGDDLLDARNGHFDQLFGGPGVDKLLGDPGDMLVED